MNSKTKENFDFESRMNKYMQTYYESKGYDVVWESDVLKDVVLIKNGEETKVEHKYRRFESAHQYDDILIEVIQDVKDKSMGWLYTSGADILNYIICLKTQHGEKPDRFYAFYLSEFKNWFYNYIETNHIKYVTSKDGYGITINISVPIKDLPQDSFFWERHL